MKKFIERFNALCEGVAILINDSADAKMQMASLRQDMNNIRADLRKPVQQLLVTPEKEMADRAKRFGLPESLAKEVDWERLS